MLNYIASVKYISMSNRISYLYFESDIVVDEYIGWRINQNTSVIEQEITCDNVDV